MKKQLLSFLFLIMVCSVMAQTNPTDQVAVKTATLKSASRLFGAKDDLTTVILVIPSGSTVNVLDSDSTYLHVIYEKNEGYILRRHAVMDETPVYSQRTEQPQQTAQEEQSDNTRQAGRYAYLEKKYGTNMAIRINAGKIWKGMNSEMVKDSWGKADKINRVVSGNTIKEEWIYRGTWLYFENNTLREWGPVKK